MSEKKCLFPPKIAPETGDGCGYNCRLKIVRNEDGNETVVQRLTADRLIWHAPGYEARRPAPKEGKKLRLLREQLRDKDGAALAALRDEDLNARKYADALLEMAVEYASNATEYALDHPNAQRRAEDIERSARRARSAVRDFVLADYELRYFVTLTLNGEAFRRDDMKTAVQKLMTWCRNRVQRCGLKYLLVPELHKDGRAVHFHGFINDAIPLVDSGTVQPPNGGRPIKRSTAKRKGYDLNECRTVYNIPGWEYGYTTAIALYGERAAAAGYVAKYVTKALHDTGGELGKLGGRYYWRSHNLTGPRFEYCMTDYDSAEGYEMDIYGGRLKVDTEAIPIGPEDRTARQGSGPFWTEYAKNGKTY